MVHLLVMKVRFDVKPRRSTICFRGTCKDCNGESQIAVGVFIFSELTVHSKGILAGMGFDRFHWTGKFA
jgi:hypothetical protein